MMRKFRRHIGKRVVAPEDAQGSAIVKHGTDTSAQILLFSVNGNLQSTREHLTAGSQRSDHYRDIRVGRPAVIEFLRMRMQSDQWEGGNNELVVSTYLKTLALRKQAAETIAYYDKEARPSAEGVYELCDWGGKNYGHPLIYYTKAYTGESLYFTVQVSEIDRFDTQWLDAAKGLIDDVGSLPIFSAMLPYLAAASGVADQVSKFANLFQFDDEIIPYCNMDLHSPSTAGNRLLQSGRYVCIPSIEAREEQVAERYKLNVEHRLVDRATGQEYQGSYFVLKANSEHQRAYEAFDQMVSTAQWMDASNSKTPSSQWLSQLTQMVQLQSDLEVIRQIEDLRFDFSEENAVQTLYAMWNHLSSESKMLFEHRFMQILEWRNKKQTHAGAGAQTG